VEDGREGKGARRGGREGMKRREGRDP